MRITRIRGKYKVIPLEMDSPKEEEGPGRTPAKGVPSILYFIDNIPGNPENLKFEVTSHFQKRKRFNGGEVVDYQAVGPNSALLLFESAEGKLMRLVTFKGRIGKVYFLCCLPYKFCSV